MIPTNTKLSNEWALRNVNAWMKNRNKISLSDLLSCADAGTLCKWLCCFVQETKKENGIHYPTTTLRSLFDAIQRTLYSNKVPLNILTNLTCGSVIYTCMTLDTVCVSLRKEGVETGDTS